MVRARSQDHSDMRRPTEDRKCRPLMQFALPIPLAAEPDLRPLHGFHLALVVETQEIAARYARDHCPMRVFRMTATDGVTRANRRLATQGREPDELCAISGATDDACNRIESRELWRLPALDPAVGFRRVVSTGWFPPPVFAGSILPCRPMGAVSTLR